MTALDDLEALVRRELTSVAAAAFNPSQRFVTERMNAATAAILEAAEKFALAVYGVTADRRKELAASVNGTAHRPTVHFQDDFMVPACDKTGRITDPMVTLSRRHVNCLRCWRTRAYLEGDEP